MATAAVAAPETYKSKFVRKFKEQPFVPLGAAATTVALVLAAVKMRQGQRQTMNYWLRARVVAQGLTIAAIVAGSYALRAPPPQDAAAAAADQDTLLERAAFEARMRAAEEAHRLETRIDGGSTGAPTVDKGRGGWWGWVGWRSGPTEAKAQVAEAQKPKTVEPTPAPPAPAVQAAEPPKGKSVWERLGWASSEKKP